jgi:hypothetical protein
LVHLGVSHVWGSGSESRVCMLKRQ